MTDDPDTPRCPIPLLEVVTRHRQSPRRAALLARQQASLATLSGHWVQSILMDPIGYGIGASHVRLRSFEPFGQYVWVLDDDDTCCAPDLLSLIDPTADACVVRVYYDEFEDRFPLDVQWAERTLELSWTTSSNVIVSRDLWMHARSAWAERYDGDFAFIEAVMAAAKRVVWIDRVVAKIDEANLGVG